jgi:hypothetical protein
VSLFVFNEDLSVFFNANEFAVEALTQGHCIAGYLSKMYPTLQDQSDSRGHFSFLCVANAMFAVSSGDAVLIEKNRYQIVGIQLDGTGLATLTLLLIEKSSCS